MKIINQRKISVLWHLICFSLVLAFTACSDDKEELQEYLTPASGSESIFEQGFSFGEAASSQSVSFEAGQQWTGVVKIPVGATSVRQKVRPGKLRLWFLSARMRQGKRGRHN